MKLLLLASRLYSFHVQELLILHVQVLLILQLYFFATMAKGFLIICIMLMPCNESRHNTELRFIFIEIGKFGCYQTYRCHLFHWVDCAMGKLRNGDNHLRKTPGNNMKL